MSVRPLILAIETSCDETAVAIIDGGGGVRASAIASQVGLHRYYGGVVPEVASRNHLLNMRPVLERALIEAERSLGDIDAFAATAGPGLAGALLIGHTTAKTLALAHGKPFLAINHMEGHLLSPFVGRSEGIRSCVSLVVSGGHTMLVHLAGFGDYRICGKTRDDAAGEAFDKVGKMLGLPYPGGPPIEAAAREGNAGAYDFPRSMLHSQDYDFSFSGLKTAVLYTLEKLPRPLEVCRPDLCAAFQEAVVEVLVAKTMRLAKELGEKCVAVSGGVSCNRRLRACFALAAEEAAVELLLPPRGLTTDNAAMIAFVALQKHQRGEFTPWEEDVDPNLQLR